jgi:hypothetical protein
VALTPDEHSALVVAPPCTVLLSTPEALAAHCALVTRRVPVHALDTKGKDVTSASLSTIACNSDGGGSVERDVDASQRTKDAEEAARKAAYAADLDDGW